VNVDVLVLVNVNDPKSILSRSKSPRATQIGGAG